MTISRRQPLHFVLRAIGVRRAPARMEHDSAKHDIEVSDESSCDGCCPTPSMPTARRRDGRGKYDRSDGKGSRMAWKPFVQKHMEAVTTGNISAWLADAKCACNKDCPQFGKCIEAVGTIRTLKICAAEHQSPNRSHNCRAPTGRGHALGQRAERLRDGTPDHLEEQANPERRHALPRRDPRPYTSALHTRTCPSRPTAFFYQHAQRTRTSFNPQHWLLCHMGLY